MAFQSAPQCVSIAINASYYGKPVANVLHAHFDDPYSQGDLDSLAAIIDLHVATEYFPIMSQNLTYLNTTVRGLSSEVDLLAIDNTSTGVGESTGVDMPGNVTLCLRLGTGHTGRTARGRFYILPTTNTQMSDGTTFTVGCADQAIEFVSGAQTLIESAGADLVILSRQLNGVVRAEAVFLRVTSIDYRNLKADSMRSRLTTGH